MNETISLTLDQMKEQLLEVKVLKYAGQLKQTHKISLLKRQIANELRKKAIEDKSI